MPSNVSYEYEKSLEEYHQASSPEAKLSALLKMQSTAPSHKGGEKLRKDISKKVSLLKKQMEKKKQKDKKKGSKPSISVRKDGIGQIVLIGIPNSGKSTLLNRLTGIGEKVAAYPFTTKKPAVGMMDYFGGKIQLVELPGIVEGSSEGKADGLQVLSVARNADAMIVVARNKKEGLLVEKELSLNGVSLNKREPGTELKKAIVINPFEETGEEELKEKIFGLLGKIIVYTKKPGGKADFEAPLGLPIGSTVKDAARHLHKEFEQKFRFARIWGSARFPGQRVSKDYELQNRDIVEIFA